MLEITTLGITKDLPHYVEGPVIVVASPSAALAVQGLVRPRGPYNFLMWERVTLYGVFRMPGRGVPLPKVQP